MRHVMLETFLLAYAQADQEEKKRVALLDKPAFYTPLGPVLEELSKVESSALPSPLDPQPLSTHRPCILERMTC